MGTGIERIAVGPGEGYAQLTQMFGEIPGCHTTAQLDRIAFQYPGVVVEPAREECHVARDIVLNQYVRTTELPQTVEIENSRPEGIERFSGGSVISPVVWHLKQCCGGCLQCELWASACRRKSQIDPVRAVLVTDGEE